MGAADAVDEYRKSEWELYDLKKDPYEMTNAYHDSSYEKTIKELKNELYRLKEEVRDKD